MTFQQQNQLIAQYLQQFSQQKGQPLQEQNKQLSLMAISQDSQTKKELQLSQLKQLPQNISLFVEHMKQSNSPITDKKGVLPPDNDSLFANSFTSKPQKVSTYNRATQTVNKRQQTNSVVDCITDIRQQLQHQKATLTTYIQRYQDQVSKILIFFQQQCVNLWLIKEDDNYKISECKNLLQRNEETYQLQRYSFEAQLLDLSQTNCNYQQQLNELQQNQQQFVELFNQNKDEELVQLQESFMILHSQVIVMKQDVQKLTNYFSSIASRVAKEFQLISQMQCNLINSISESKHSFADESVETNENLRPIDFFNCETNEELFISKSQYKNLAKLLKLDENISFDDLVQSLSLQIQFYQQEQEDQLLQSAIQRGGSDFLDAEIQTDCDDSEEATHCIVVSKLQSELNDLRDQFQQFQQNVQSYRNDDAEDFELLEQLKINMTQVITEKQMLESQLSQGQSFLQK